MFAISHAATALAIKRRFPEAPMGWLLVSVQLPEILWVILNLAHIEHDTAHMPYSHSVAGALALAFAAWLFLEKVLRRRAVAAAVAAGIVSHLVLDLVIHKQAIVLVPFLSSVYLGVGLYDMPPLAIALASAYGVLCWLIFGGGKALLAVIVFLNLASLSFLQSPLGEEPELRVAAAAVQVAVAVALVWYCSRHRAAALEHPDRRLSRAFA